MLWQFEMRQAGAFLDDIAQIGKKRVIAIRLVETVVSVGPARDNTSRAQSGQFLLDRAQGEAAHDAWRADGLEHPGERGDRIAGLVVYLADRTNCVVWLGLFFDGNPGAGQKVLAQARAGSV